MPSKILKYWDIFKTLQLTLKKEIHNGCMYSSYTDIHTLYNTSLKIT